MSKFAVVNEIKRHIDAWLSLVERCVRDAEVAGSNPVASIKGIFYKGFRESSMMEKSLKFT